MIAEVRTMVPGDLDAVIAMARETPSASRWPADAYERAVQQGDTAALVASVENALAGFAIATLVSDIAELEQMVVAGAFRRQGIGAALLRRVLSWSVARGARRLELEVRAGNTAALALYDREGFVREGRRPDYYHDPQEDAILMAVDLPASAKEVEKND